MMFLRINQPTRLVVGCSNRLSRFCFQRNIHKGCATATDTLNFIEKNKIHQESVIPKLGLHVGRLGVGSPSMGMQGDRRMNSFRDGIKIGKSNLIQVSMLSVNKVHSEEETDPIIAESLDAIALNEILQDETKREEVVVSVLLDDGFDGSSDGLQRLDTSFLDSEINRALKKLELETIDILMVRIPASMMTEFSKEQAIIQLQHVSAYLESQCGKGRIQAYGFAVPTSRTRPLDYMSSEFNTTIFDVLGKNKGLVAFQFPFNMQENRLTLITLCQRNGIFSISERPLDTVDSDGEPIRFMEYRDHNGEEAASTFNLALNQSIYLEEKYKGFLDEESNKKILPSEEQVCFGQTLANSFDDLKNYELWRYIRDYQLNPEMQRVLEKIAKNRPTHDWAMVYRMSTLNLFNSYSELRELEAHHRSQELKKKLLQLLPQLMETHPLEFSVLKLLLYSEVGCILLYEQSNDRIQLLQDKNFPVLQHLEDTLSSCKKFLP